MINIERIVNYENDQNCYLVYDENRKGIIIDPGCSCDEIMEAVENAGAEVSHIFLTHCHYDHIGGLEELREKIGAKVCASFECNKNIQNPNINVSSFFSNQIKALPADIILTDGCETAVGDMLIKTICTPGHTNGSVCFLIEDDLFSGDTLFLRNAGRWDLPTGDGEKLKGSIINKLYTLDDDVVVHPGHGNDTKIYYEKRYNTYVRG